jgi:hypothetical protein
MAEPKKIGRRGSHAWHELEYQCDFEEEALRAVNTLKVERELLLRVFEEAKVLTAPPKDGGPVGFGSLEHAGAHAQLTVAVAAVEAFDEAGAT